MMWIVIAVLVVLFSIAYMVYKLPTDKAPRKPKKEKVEIKKDDDKDWKEIASRWEKKNNSLLGDVEKLSMNEKKILREIDGYKSQLKEVMDKMALEKSWREKEQGNVEKIKAHEKDLKDQIMRTEKDLEKEHSTRLNMERELQELKIKFETVLEEKRVATTNAASLSTTVNQLQLQVKDLTKINAELKQRREDVQWVAKSEYDELLKKFKDLNKA